MLSPRIQTPHKPTIVEIDISVTDDCPYYFKEEINNGITMFYGNWVESFGDPYGRVVDNLAQVQIDCSSKMKTVRRGYNTKGEFLVDFKVIGLAYSKEHIWFYAGADEEIKRLGETSFIHELTHATIAAIEGNEGDADHEGTLYHGWHPEHTEFVNKTKEKLCDLEEQGLLY